MKIFENKNGAKTTLLATIVLFGIGVCGYLYYDLQSSAIFAMIVSGVCAAFCVKKIAQESFLLVQDDGFTVKKAGKEGKFYFKDIDEIRLRMIDKKQSIELINIKFKKDGLNMDVAYGLIQPINETDAVILDKYEKSKYEIYNALKDKFQKAEA
ncbi:MAG: molybdate transport repressor [Campylobacter sp.]|nr:molybdate transport repressor [Campylobacter sp.]